MTDTTDTVTVICKGCGLVSVPPLRPYPCCPERFNVPLDSEAGRAVKADFASIRNYAVNEGRRGAAMTDTTDTGLYDLTKTQRAALAEADAHRGLGYVWKPKTMERLAQLGLVEQRTSEPRRKLAWYLTPAGRAALAGEG